MTDRGSIPTLAALAATARIALAGSVARYPVADALEPFLKHDNHQRPHFGLKGKTPISRIPSNNLSRHDT